MVETGAITRAQADEAKAHPALVMDRASMDARNSSSTPLPTRPRRLRRKVARAQCRSDRAHHAGAEAAGGRRLAATDVIGKYGKKDRAHEAAVVMMKPDGAVSALIGASITIRPCSTAPSRRAASPARRSSPLSIWRRWKRASHPGIRAMTSRWTLTLQAHQFRQRRIRHPDPGRCPGPFRQHHHVNLVQEVGVDKVIGAARRTGIVSPLTPTPSLALGTSEVTPLELTGAYAAFANGGYRVYPISSPRWIRAARCFTAAARPCRSA